MIELLEREHELGVVEEILADTSDSTRVLLIEGAAGTGKTSLLAAATSRATDLGLSVAFARGDEFEREFGFGIARQLLEQHVSDTHGRERELLFGGAAGLARSMFEPGAATAVDEPAALHGLYWVLSGLAKAGPLMLAIDDAHWSDPDSLRWISYVLRRGDGVPVTFALTVRRAQARDPLLAEISAFPVTRSVTVAQLSEAGVSRVIARELAGEPAPEFTAACHQLTDGNPFSLRELVLELRAEGVTPTPSGLAQLGGLVPERLQRLVLLRTGRLGSEAVALARAVAVLGDRASVASAAELAVVPQQSAELVCDRLAAADVLADERPLRFAHSLLRTAVYGDIPAGERRLTHGRAARILGRLGAEPERIAAQLLMAESAAEPWAVQALREGAQQALGRGSPRAAAAYLRRAVADLPVSEVTGKLRLELARAAFGSGASDAAELVREAAAECDDPSDRSSAHWMLGSLGQLTGDTTLALAEMERAALEARAAALSGAADGIAEALEADWLAVAQMDQSVPPKRALERLAELDLRPPGGEGGERMLLGVIAFDRMRRAVPLDRCVELAERALSGGAAPLLGQSGALLLAAQALIYADALDAVERRLEQEVAIASAAGQVIPLAIALWLRAECEFRRGLLRESEADALAVNELAGLPALFALSVQVLVEAASDRAGPGAVEELLSSTGQLELPAEQLWPTSAGFARGQLRLVQQRYAEALGDLSACGQMALRGGSHNPAAIPWRSHAALALHGLERGVEARALVAEELALAQQFGAPRAIGIALRIRGQLEPGAAGIALLEESVDVLAGSVSALEHAKALSELGAALRRAGRRSDARARLREAVLIADRLGAHAVSAHARDELSASGARLRRPELGGRDSLTPGELRIARLAARGATNREIAQSLFLSLKTVEMHLGRAYRKLEISSRAELATALEDSAALPADAT